MLTNILLIEDDLVIADFMQVVLAQDAYQTTVATTGSEALNYLQTEEFDLILLDLGLPDIDGMDLLRIFRKQMRLPIIVISARSAELDKVNALDLGADDFMTKPFGTAELKARIRTALRHHQLTDQSQLERATGDLRIDMDKRLVYRGDEVVHLTKNEYKILKHLFINLGKVVTYEQLTTTVWGPYSRDTQTLRVNVSNIRKKIEKNTFEPTYLITEIGVGYRLMDYNTSE